MSGEASTNSGSSTTEFITKLQEFEERVKVLMRDMATMNYAMEQHVADFTIESKDRFPQMVDVGFLYREIGDALQDIKASANAWEEKLSEIMGCAVSAYVLKNPMKADSDKVCGTLANGFLQIKIQPKFGKKDSPEHKILAAHFGIAPENAHLFTPHFVQVSEKLTADAEKGLPPLPGLIGQYKKFGMKYVRKKNL